MTLLKFKNANTQYSFKLYSQLCLFHMLGFIGSIKIQINL